MTSRGAARRYARALFDVAQAERHDPDRIARELDEFAAGVSGHEALARVLSNPAIPAPRKRALVEQLLARSPVDDILGRVLLLLASRDRLTILPDLAAAFRDRLMDHRQVVRAALTTAMPLGEDRVAALRQGLARATGREVQLDVQVDPAIVGGAVARVGSTVFDGSVTTQLEKLKQQLVDVEV